MSRTGTALVLAVAAIVGSACGDDGDDADLTVHPEEELEDAAADPEIDWPGDGSETETVDLGQDLVAELPVSWEVGTHAGNDNPIVAAPLEVTDQDPETVQDCDGPRAWLDPGEGGPSLDIALHPVGCDSNHQISNGFHGTYASLDEVPEPQGVEEHDVAAGSLTTFTQRYDEYTNEHNEYEDHVGLLELDTPPDAEHPTLMILDAKGEYAMSDLVALAETIDTAS